MICLFRFQVQIVFMIYGASHYSSSGSFDMLPPISHDEIEIDEMDAVMVKPILSNYRWHIGYYLNFCVGRIMSACIWRTGIHFVIPVQSPLSSVCCSLIQTVPCAVRGRGDRPWLRRH